MKDTALINPTTKKIYSVKSMCTIGILSALAAVTMLFEIPLWFAPSFYKIDLSEIFVLFGAFSLGMVGGCIIELLKIIVNFLLNGTTTAGVGEFANFVVGCAFVMPAALIYRKTRTLKGMIISLSVGTFSLTIIGSLINFYVLLPVFSKFYGMPIEAFVDMGNKLNSNITNLKTLVIFATAPFNILKGLLVSVLMVIIYPKISKILEKSGSTIAN